jgi:chemotaxis protein MotB
MNHPKEQIFETENPNYLTAFVDMLISLLILFVFFMVYQFFANQETLHHLIVKSKQSQFLEVFNKEFAPEIKRGLVQSNIDGNIQRLSFGETLLFEIGEVDLKPGGPEILDRCMNVFEEFAQEQRIYKKIQVEGHTCDARVMPYGRLWRRGITDNWDLSAVRALNVVKYFTGNSRLGISRLDPALFSGTGYSYFQGSPGQLERNRKIEMVVIYSTDVQDP